jgi:hypothetical protein
MIVVQASRLLANRRRDAGTTSIGIRRRVASTTRIAVSP